MKNVQSTKPTLTRLIQLLLKNETDMVKSVNFGNGNITKKQMMDRKRILKNINDISEIDIELILKEEI